MSSSGRGARGGVVVAAGPRVKKGSSSWTSDGGAD